MKIMMYISLLASLTGCAVNSRITEVRPKLVKVKSNPENGFHFPYYLYIPKSYVTNTRKRVPLIVIPNNSGKNSDDPFFHERWVIRDFSRSAKDLSEESTLPVLMPVFPRPKTGWQIYTHALDRDTLLVSKGPLKRIDLQLIAMVADAKVVLKAEGIELLDRFFLNGYSASGTFANRFAFLHPSRLLGVAAGGVNGIPTLPIEELGGTRLTFPVGVGDIERFTGEKFDYNAYQKLPQFIYMGAKDENDTLPFRDAWSEDEAELIKSVLPEKMMPDRWEKSILIYKESKMTNATLKTYKEYGHEYTHKIRREISDFIRSLY